MASSGWNTIESDAGVFTSMIEDLGVSGVQFEELLALDVDALRSLSPLYGLIFLFKYPTSPPPSRHTDQPEDGAYDPDASSTLFFAHQTIQNACATQALLSILLNKDSTSPLAPSQPADQQLDVGPTLQSLRDFAAPLPPDLRGEVLSNSEEVRKVHNAFARAAPFVDETVRDSHHHESDDVYHFIAYTAVNGLLYELDGLQPHPISHGACEPDSASFAAAVVPVLQRRVGRYGLAEIRFNLLAVCRDVRIRCRELGDGPGLAREEQKRRDWAWENALRRWNFVGFAGEVLRGVARKHGEKDKVEAWFDEGRTRTKERVTEGRRRQQRRREGGTATAMEVDD